MRTCIIFVSSVCAVLAQNKGQLPYHRLKRDASGALDIVTNNAQPIHADVKVESIPSENIGTNPEKSEHGDVKEEVSTANEYVGSTTSAPEKVTPPKDVTKVADDRFSQSLRKSWPLTSRLDLIRSVSRLMTLTVMLVSGAVEFYPLLQHLFNIYGTY